MSLGNSHDNSFMERQGPKAAVKTVTSRKGRLSGNYASCGHQNGGRCRHHGPCCQMLSATEAAEREREHTQVCVQESGHLPWVMTKVWLKGQEGCPGSSGEVQERGRSLLGSAKLPANSVLNVFILLGRWTVWCQDPAKVKVIQKDDQGGGRGTGRRGTGREWGDIKQERWRQSHPLLCGEERH